MKREIAMEKQTELTIKNNAEGLFLDVCLREYLTHGRTNEMLFSESCIADRIEYEAETQGDWLPKCVDKEHLPEQAAVYYAEVFYYLELFCNLFHKEYNAFEYQENAELAFANYKVPVILYGKCCFANIQALMNDAIDDVCCLFEDRWRIPAFRSRLSALLGIKSGYFMGEDIEKERGHVPNPKEDVMRRNVVGYDPFEKRCIVRGNEEYEM